MRTIFSGTLSLMAFLIIGIGHLNAQPGVDCNNPFTIASLPFNQTGMTTCGFGDVYSSLDACGSSYLNGDDFVFAYTSAGAESITITLANTGTWVGLFVMDGCPNLATTTCVPPVAGGGACAGGGTNNTSIGGNPFGTWTLSDPGTYYFVISTFPSPQCTAFDIDILTTTISGGVGNACYTVSTSIPYTPDPYNVGNIVTFPDDEFSSAFPIGFDFCFMGTTYNQFLLSSNGYITFEAACATQYSSWSTVAIPDPQDDIRSSILGPWQDIDPSVGGSLRYITQGIAPNRRLVVNFENIPMFSGTCNSQLFTGQIILYETSNVIENFIQTKTVCTSWNSGNAVQGLTDASGTVAVQVAGRNNTNWTATNDGTRFTPTCAPCFIILAAGYKDFSGEATPTGNQIIWETLYEDNLTEFVVERSLDGTTFHEMEHFEAIGNEMGAVYETIDPRPLRPVTFYRLKELTTDGAISYSNIINVRVHDDQSPIQNVFVDPSANELVIQMDLTVASEHMQMDLVDALGRSLFEQEGSFDVGVHEIRLPLNTLPSGYYLLQMQDGSAYKVAHRFVKP